MAERLALLRFVTGPQYGTSIYFLLCKRMHGARGKVYFSSVEGCMDLGDL
jgi:hypothetical protein